MVTSHSLIDLAGRLPGGESLALNTRVPVGLLDRIDYQPHTGVDREQVFTTRSNNGQHRLVWRLIDEKMTTAFVFAEVTPVEWAGLVDGECSAEAILSRDRQLVFVEVTTRAGDEGGRVVLTSCNRASIACRGTWPDEKLKPTKAVKDRRAAPPWVMLNLPALRDPATLSGNRSTDWENSHRIAAAASTVDDAGATHQAKGCLVVVTDAQGVVFVRVFDGASLARVAVERQRLAATVGGNISGGDQ